MEEKQEICPRCGGTDFVTGKQNGYGGVLPKKRISALRAQPLMHLICRNCGTVVRSYIEDPQDFN